MATGSNLDLLRSAQAAKRHCDERSIEVNKEHDRRVDEYRAGILIGLFLRCTVLYPIAIFLNVSLIIVRAAWFALGLFFKNFWPLSAFIITLCLLYLVGVILFLTIRVIF